MKLATKIKNSVASRKLSRHNRLVTYYQFANRERALSDAINSHKPTGVVDMWPCGRSVGTETPRRRQGKWVSRESKGSPIHL
jgi:hypothetical protein